MKTMYLPSYRQLYIAVLLLLSVGCKKGETTITQRSFYMGVTPWPADFTVPEVDTAYSFINTHCDMVSHHFDEGIPYEEAIKNTGVPIALKEDIDYRLLKTASSKKIFLSVSALNLTRKEKSDYYSKSIVTDSIKNYWKHLDFDNPKIITAYLNYISWLIDACKPIYINFGVESNNPLWDPVAFTHYTNFISQVYAQLKTKYPSIPLMVSFIVDENTASLTNAQKLLPYTDFIALSAYPYVTVSSSATGNTNPDLFPANYFEKFIQLDVSKPLAFAETSYLAEPLSIPSYNLQKEGTEEWQDRYLKKILELCQSHNAKFLIWFCSKDYDAAVVRMKQLGLYQDLFSFWVDTGLKDENGRERKAMRRWVEWVAKARG
jgi:hypothetical protein